MVDPLALHTRQELADFIADKNDDELDELATELGVARVLQAVFDGMALEFVASEAPREKAVIQWEIQGPDRRFHTWQNVSSRDGFEAYAAVRVEPNVSLRVGMAPFLRLMAGLLRGMEALSSGSLKLKGDIEMAMEMEAWFGLVPAPPARKPAAQD